MITEIDKKSVTKAVRKELADITKRGGGILNPESVVEFARDATTALHSMFDWDDSEAAEKWRVHQARNLIRVQVTYEPRADQEMQVYVSLPQDRDSEGGYRRMVDVLSSEDRRKQLLGMALAELESFKKKYHQLTELAGVFKALDSAQKKSTPRKKRQLIS